MPSNLPNAADTLPTTYADNVGTKVTASMFNDLDDHANKASGMLLAVGGSDGRSGYAGPRPSYSVNPLLNIWQRTVQAYTANNGPAGPDRLFITLAGTDTISCTQNTANRQTAKGATFCLACAFTLGTGAGASGVFETFKTTTDWFNFFRGQTVTRSWWVLASVATAVRVGIKTDGTAGTTTFSAYHTGDGTWQLLSVSAAVPVDATFVQCQVFMGASGTFSIGAHATQVASVFVDPYAIALSPFDDLARCQRYCQRWNLGVGQNVALGQAVSATAGLIQLGLLAQLALAPTLTVSSNAHFGLAQAAGALATVTAITPIAFGVNWVNFQATVASGLVAGNATLLQANNAAAWLMLEANP